MTSGCQAKLGIFKSGVLKPDMPAIYIDLDTVILGPIEQAFQFRKDDRSIVMFQSAVLPFLRLGADNLSPNQGQTLCTRKFVVHRLSPQALQQ